MSAASDHYNALPFEQRQQLAPLLEEYRLMGIAEARRELDGVERQLRDRERSIRRRVAELQTAAFDEADRMIAAAKNQERTP